jgi:L-fuculose-phosphate aldolase
MKWQSERTIVVQAAQQLLRLGLVAATSGNVSMRLEGDEKEGLIAVTPAGTDYETMTPEDIVVVDYDVDVIEGDTVPSSESLTHVAVYKARRDISAVIHTHSIYASVLAVAGVALPPILDELVAYLGGPVEVAEYGFPSTEDLGEKAIQAMGERNAVFIRNHGVLAAGRDMPDALRACELVERAAQIYIQARALGSVRTLPSEVVEAEVNIFRMRQGTGD